MKEIIAWPNSRVVCGAVSKINSFMCFILFVVLSIVPGESCWLVCVLERIILVSFPDSASSK
ncbi:hypothetical protein D3C71_1707520 [compost metagenome]